MINGESNYEIYNRLTEYVKGHDKAKKALITLVNRSKLRYKQKFTLKMYDDYLLQTSKILLIGASGTGKTYLVESLEKIADFPLLKFDATKLNPTGASGGIKEETMRKLIVDNAIEISNRNPHKYPEPEDVINQTVVFIDEIDKLGNSFDSSGKWNSHVQSNFLTLFDNRSEFSGVSFIFAGAFTSITNKEKLNNSIGFTNLTNNNNNNKLDLLENEIEKSGLLPELIGRMTAIVELDVFDKNDYKSILLEKILPKKQMDMAAFGIFNIDLSEKQIYTIIEDSIKSNQGVRSMQRAVDKIFLDIEFEADNVSQMKRLELNENLY